MKIKKKKKFKPGDNFVKWERKCDKKIFQRYYHIFNKDMVNEYVKCVTGLVKVLGIYNQMGNWVIWFKKL